MSFRKTGAHFSGTCAGFPIRNAALRLSAAVHCHAAIQHVDTAVISALNAQELGRCKTKITTAPEQLALDHVSDPRGAAKPALIPSSLWGAAMPPTFFAVLFCRLEIFQRTTKSK
jgi:hypothetical protein